MVKRRVCVTLDGELVDLHKWKSPVCLSTDLNNFLRESLLSADELKDVESQILKYEKKLLALRSKQARLEQEKVVERNNRNNYALVHDTLVRMQETNECIGINQLRLLAEHRQIDFDGLLEYCEEQDFKIVEIQNGETKKMKMSRKIGE